MKKRICTLILALALLCTLLPWSAMEAHAESYSGTCGDHVTWTFDSATGVLKISGSGTMFSHWTYGGDYPYRTPWDSFRNSIRTVTISSGVTSIGKYAFYGCAQLTGVSIPNTVKNIGEYAFAYCTDLTSVIIPEGVVSIRKGTFKYCQALADVTLPDTVTIIRESAFESCASLTQISIPDSVTSLEWYAFYDCGLTSVSIPDSVTEIGYCSFGHCSDLVRVTIGKGLASLDEYAFYGCNRLTTFSAAEENPYFSSDNSGVLFDKNKAKLILCPQNFKGSYTIPNRVTDIGDSAFRGCTGLTGVTIPDSVVTIGRAAFRGCTGLTGVTIPNSVETIGVSAFCACPGITSVVIPGNVTYIGEEAFGYIELSDDMDDIDKNPGFSICGALNSAGEQYAEENGFPFEGGVAPSVAVQPRSMTVQLGSSVYLRTSSAGTGLQYQWQYKKADQTHWSNWSGKTSDSVQFTASATNDGCRYRCVIKNKYGAATTEEALLNCSDQLLAPEILMQPKTAALSIGGHASFHVVSSGTELSYQWQYRKYGEEDWTDWSGKTSDTLNVTLSSTNCNCQYRCVATNPGGTAVSEPAGLYRSDRTDTGTCGESMRYVLYLDSGLLEITGAGKMDKWEEDVYYEPDHGGYEGHYYVEWAELSPWVNDRRIKSVVIGEGVADIGYAAFRGCTELKDITVPSTVSEIGTYAIGYADLESTYVDAVIYGYSGTVAQSYAKSNTIAFVDRNSPVLAYQPKSASVSLGNSVCFRVAAAGSGLKYQWEYKKDGAADWTVWSKKTAAALTVTASATNNGCQYRCVVSNSAGSVTSSAATLTVTTTGTKPSITTQPKNASAAVGGSVTFKVAASGSGLKYQWQFRKSGKTEWSNWSGKTSASLAVTASATNNGCQYRCVVSNSAGSVTSGAAMLTVTNVPPAVLKQPADASAAIGKTVTFTVSAAGSGVKYQWQYRKIGETTWHNWSGKTAASLSVTASATNNGCQYRCYISNSYGGGNSAAATLTVTNVKPAIRKHPANASVALGKSVTFSVTAVGSNLSYQWQFSKDGGKTWSNWSGKTAATLTVTGSATNGGCKYRCVVKNTYGSVTSNPATLTVK